MRQLTQDEQKLDQIRIEYLTMTQFRKRPGYYLFRVQHDGRAFILTERGKAVARLVPLDEGGEILSDGTFRGEIPLTYRARALLR